MDSCGAIGSLPHDALSARPETVGEFTARTALLEVAASGAVPSFASVSVSNAPQTAELLLAGVRAVLGSLPLVVSTEKNMPTAMTALGVTVTGSCPKGALRLGQARPGDLLWCAGVPRVGAEALAADAVCPLRSLSRCFSKPRVHAIKFRSAPASPRKRGPCRRKRSFPRRSVPSGSDLYVRGRLQSLLPPRGSIAPRPAASPSPSRLR